MNKTALLFVASALWLIPVPTAPAQNIEQLQGQADKGDVQAMVDLGVEYAEGKTVPKDYAKAAGWWKKAADKGNSDAEFGLAVLYRGGLGVRENKSLAVDLFRKSANQGNINAQVRLAGMYYDGVGVPEDHRQAVFWYQKAADSGNAEAQFYLGLSYDNGRGISEDSAQAVLWFRKAAEQSYTGAQFALGMEYAGGKGVPQDYVEAYIWFDISVAGQFDTQDQHDLAVKMRDKTARLLTRTDLTRAQERAKKWFDAHPKDSDRASEETTSVESSPVEQDTVEKPSTIVCDESTTCTHDYDKGQKFKTISARGIAVRVGLAKTGLTDKSRYMMAVVVVANNTSLPLDVIPSACELEEIEPKQKHLRYLRAEQVARSDDHGYGYSTVMKLALQSSTIAPGQSIGGVVYFERDTRVQLVHLRIPIGSTVYDFPFTFN